MTARPPIAQFGDAIEVTQDDRDAAKALLDVLHLHEHATGTFRSWDDAVSAFARHRTSTALPLAHPAALFEPETQTALGDLPSRIQGWIGKAKNRGSDRIELDFATVELLVRLARLAHPAAPQGEEVDANGNMNAPVERAKYDELERDFAAIRKDYGKAAYLIEQMRERWNVVAEQLDHVSGGMHASLEDAASAMASICDNPRAALAPAAIASGRGEGE